MLGWLRRPFANEAQVPVELGHAARSTAGVGSHLRDEEAAFGQRQKIVGDVGERATRREQESRTTGIRHIEEEEAVVAPKQSQQAAAREDVFVGGEVTVVRLVLGSARAWNRNRPDDLAVAR